VVRELRTDRFQPAEAGAPPTFLVDPRAGRGFAICLLTSFAESPSLNAVRNIKSSETLASPASIFATRDWLDPINLSSRNTPREASRDPQ
jgi:hypothetical protein